jgi:hypothetical protein
MELDRKYAIIHDERIVMKYGPTVLLSIEESPYNKMKVFMQKHYNSVFSDEDIESINSQKVSLNLIYKGMCEKSKSYILAIE